LTSKATNAQTSADYKIEDGTIKFKNKEAYIKAYQKLSTASDEEISNWNKQLSFKTLKTKTEEDIRNQCTDITYDSILGESPSQLNSALYSVANSKGIFQYGDTILKVKDEYLYLITNGDKSLIENIDNNVDISKNKNIIKIRHIVPLKPHVNDSLQKSSLQKIAGLINNGGYSYRTYTREYQLKNWIGTIDKREYIQFDAYMTSNGKTEALTIYYPDGSTKVIEVPVYNIFNCKITNQCQTKFATWQTPSSVNLNWGQIDVTGKINNETHNSGTMKYTSPSSVKLQIYTNGNFSTLTATYNYLSNRGLIGGTTTITYNCSNSISQHNSSNN
jgi:hypothetical protein